MRVGSYQLAFVEEMETLSDWRLTTICCKSDYQWRHNRRLFCSPHYKNKYIPISVSFQLHTTIDEQIYQKQAMKHSPEAIYPLTLKSD